MALVSVGGTMRRSKAAASLLEVALDLLDGLHHIEGRSLSCTTSASSTASTTFVSRTGSSSVCSSGSSQALGMDAEPATARSGMSKGSTAVDGLCPAGAPNSSCLAKDGRQQMTSFLAGLPPPPRGDGRASEGGGSEGAPRFFGGCAGARVANSKNVQGTDAVASSMMKKHRDPQSLASCGLASLSSSAVWEGMATRPTLLQNRLLSTKNCLSTTHGSGSTFHAHDDVNALDANDKCWSSASLYQEPDGQKMDATEYPSRIDLNSLQCFGKSWKSSPLTATADVGTGGVVPTGFKHICIPQKILMTAPIVLGSMSF
eukprot:TRINITY_DN73169_c0_g1_i1.p1 TRINITY_DN73169_c0_g1~~TRINITY_DN73169_c0_g1_i1.p1  ORF type:complete len:316 (-),score=57.67 TRINITY_DN73169_c0_g1_i1:676-1623(-)